MKLDGSLIFSREQILLRQKKWLNMVFFPHPLEQAYRKEYEREAAYEFRYRAVLIFILYAFLSLGIYQILPANQIKLWFAYYSWVGIIITIAWGMSFFKQFNHFFDIYTGIGSIASIAITFILITTLKHGQYNVLFHAGMMYAIIIIYGFVGMRFYTATIAGWLGGLIGLFISLWFKEPIEWTYLNRTYTFSSILGMSLAYITDRQHRENYLQNCIIKLHKAELTKQAEQLSILSRIDGLTGLANRRYLDEVMHIEWNRALRHQTPISIMMIDIDYFKRYNDSLGHIEGDKCLQTIAHHIAMLASRSGELVARYGGEEFLLVFPYTTQTQMEILAKRLMLSIQESRIKHPNSNVSPYVTISIGIATTTPKLGDELATLIDQADHALYIAKSNGRNQFYIAT